MDTLCVPVHPRHRDYRIKAIRLMAKTFHEASAVLVLDRELEIVSAATTSFLELGIRILCSGWTKRVWTLEEGSFSLDLRTEDGRSIEVRLNGSDSEEHGIPDRLHFQMLDGPFSPWLAFDARGPLEEVSEILLDSAVFSQLLVRIPPFAHHEDSMAGRDVLGALKHRSTSKEEDIPLCAASILRMDITPILSAPDQHHRLAAFYRQLRGIPEGIVWIHDPAVEKVTVVPYRWAPARLTAIPETFYFQSMEDLYSDERGAHVRYAGFILDPECVEVPANGTIRLASATTGEVFGVIRASASDPQHSLPDLTESGAGPLCGVTAGTRLAVILKPDHMVNVLPKIPNAAIFRILQNSRGSADASTMNQEIVGTIIGYRHFVSSESPDFMASGHGEVVRIYCMPTERFQKWCLT